MGALLSGRGYTCVHCGRSDGLCASDGALTPALIAIAEDRTDAITVRLAADEESETRRWSRDVIFAQVKAAVMQTELLLTASDRKRLDAAAAAKEAAKRRRYGGRRMQ